MAILARCTAVACTVAMIIMVLMLAFFVVPRLLPFSDPSQALDGSLPSSRVLRL